MKKTLTLTATALAGILGMAAHMADAQAATSAEKATEKCYGIAKASKNDCHAPAHSCAGSGTVDADPAEFIIMPLGLCEKIVGGSLTVGEPKMTKQEPAPETDAPDAE